MSTTGGPRLEGIGRTGDSDIVMCIDAHDAGSYPGEPTTNLFPQPSLASSAVGTTWSGTNGTWGTSTATVESVMGPDGKYIKAVSNRHSASGGGTAHIWFAYSSLSGMGSAQRNFTLTNGTAYTCSWWWKAINSRWAIDNNIYFVSPNYGTSTDNLVTTEWTKAYVYFTFGGTTGTYSPSHYFYTCGDGFKVWYAMLQIEEKTYGTPAVRSQLSGFSQQGYNARPASTDLMIHGNVGTGTNFYDSSPGKHTITTTGSMTHSTTQSKFSGGSIYGSGSAYFTIADSPEFDFGTNIDFTIDYWMYHSGTITSWDCPFELGSIYNNGTGNFLNTDGRIRTHVTTAAYDSAGGVITENTWYHIAVVRRGAVWKTYVNGVSVATTTRGSDTIGQYTDAFHIHNGVHTTGYGWNGYIDEFRVTKGTALWTGAFTPPTRRSNDGPVVDLSGSNNAGNFATTDMTDVKTARRGQVIEPIGSAVWDFDGTDDIIDLGNINYNGLPGLTVATWVYSSNFAANDSFMSSWGDNAYSNYAWLLFMSQWTSRKIDWLISSNGTGYNRCAGATALTDNRWYHVAATWTTSAMKLYLNGVEDGSQTSPSAIMNNDFNTFIGCDSDGSSESKRRFFGGQMGKATIWKVALTATQIKQNFNTLRSRFKV